MYKKLYVSISSILFAIFLLFSYFVHRKVFTQFDSTITVQLQDRMPRLFDTFFSLLSFIGNIEITGTILVIILLGILIRKRKVIWVLTVGFFFGLMHGFELYGKTFVKHVPPPHVLLRTNLPFQFPELYISQENSYPSGHAGRAFFVTTIIALLALKYLRLTKNQKMFFIGCLACYDVLMCVSRVYLAEHWTSDVIGGSLLGASFALLTAVVL